MQRRVKALKRLQRDVFDIEMKFYEELHVLEHKYEDLCSSLYDKVTPTSSYSHSLTCYLRRSLSGGGEGIMMLCICVCVCLSAAPQLHAALVLVAKVMCCIQCCLVSTCYLSVTHCTITTAAITTTAILLLLLLLLLHCGA